MAATESRDLIVDWLRDLGAALARMGEDVHASKATRLAGYVADGTEIPEQAVDTIRTMRMPDRVRVVVQRALADLNTRPTAQETS